MSKNSQEELYRSSRRIEDLLGGGVMAGGGVLATESTQQTLATESTLNSLLNQTIATQDIEILLVRDTGASDVVVQQIREYSQGTGLWTTSYENVSGNAYTPIGALEYLDPSAVLNLLLAETLGQGVDIDSQVTILNSTLAKLSADPSTATLQTSSNVVLSNILGEVTSIDAATTKVDTDDVTVTNVAGAGAVNIQDGGNSITVDATSLPLPTGASTETTLAALLAELQDKADLSETQPISAVILPLPTGAATETTLATIESKDFSTENTSAAILADLALKADLSETQPVSNASLPLPAGASTEATLSSIDGKDFSTQTTSAAILTELALKADLTETQPVSAASLPLPTGAATETTTNSINTKTPALSQSTMANSVPVAIASDQSTIPVQVNPLALTLTAANFVGAPNFTFNVPTGTRYVRIEGNPSAFPGAGDIGIKGVPKNLSGNPFEITCPVGYTLNTFPVAVYNNKGFLIWYY